MSGQQQGRSDAGAKVTVACKLPAGIMMRAHVKHTEREAVMGGGTRDCDVFRWTGEEHHINGTAVPQGKSPKCEIIAGFALTPNVNKDLWENWYDANRDQPYCKNKLIFAYPSLDTVQGRARENETRVTGFEPIDPENPGKKAGTRSIVKADVK